MDNILIPAIIPEKFEDILELQEKVSNIFNKIQVDVVDGEFVKNKSWPYINKKDEDILGSLFLEYEVDLMVKNPEEVIDFWLKADAQKFIFHLSSTEKMDECILKVKESGKEVWIAVTTNDNLSELKKYINKINGVQCMGISELGFQGQPFNEDVYELMSFIKLLKEDIKLSIDGGVSIENAKKLTESGADFLVSGSKLLNGDIVKNKEQFISMLKS